MIPIPSLYLIAAQAYLSIVFVFTSCAFLFGGYSTLMTGQPGVLSPILSVVALVLFGFGIGLRISARRSMKRRVRDHLAKGGEAASSSSQSRFVLLLYPFDGSSNPSFLVNWGSGASGTAWLLGRNWSLEDLVVMSARNLFPVVALGPASSNRGAARLPVSEADWQTTVRDLAEKAAAVVFFPGVGSGLSWEFETLTSKTSLIRKTLVVSVSSRRSGELAHLLRDHHRGRVDAFAQDLKIPVEQLFFHLLEGIYFFDRATDSEWGWFYLPLRGGHPSHLGSLIFAMTWPSPPGTKVKLFSHAGLSPIRLENADSAEKAADRALQEVRLQKPRIIANALFDGIETSFVVIVLASLFTAASRLVP